MGDRRLYDSRAFDVEALEEHPQVWHLFGTFASDAIRTRYERSYRIRVAPDPRWVGVRRVVFRTDRVYECESVESRSRRRVYGSGRWYLSPYAEGGRASVSDNPEKNKFFFEDFEVE